MVYFSVLFPPEAKNAEEEENEGFYEFSSSLNNFTRYSSLRHLATLSYTTDMFNNASIVSSIEFDKDQELFAIAGKHIFIRQCLPLVLLYTIIFCPLIRKAKIEQILF